MKNLPICFIIVLNLILFVNKPLFAKTFFEESFEKSPMKINLKQWKKKSEERSQLGTEKDSARDTPVKVEPAEVVHVRGERYRLSPEKPEGWAKGTKLRQIMTLSPGRGTPAFGAVDPDSVVVRLGKKVLIRGKDYLMDTKSGSLGIGPKKSITPKDTVIVDYNYSLCRLDSQVRMPDGRQVIRKGESHLTIPQPPVLGKGEKRIANIFVDYHCNGRNAEIFPIRETAGEAQTLTTPGRIPKIMAKIKAGKKVKIVCWGDSVTVGGDASGPGTRYVAVFEKRLKEKFPNAEIGVETIAVGGSGSRHWLYPDNNSPRYAARFAECRWQRIVDAKPDLVTIEFVNDVYLRPSNVIKKVYMDILNLLRKIGAEVILITPHFTRMEMMKFTTLRDVEKRSYVLELCVFAEKNNIALADASSRWGHLWKEGIPYVTLLRNGINHPDDRGHAIFADELIKCFAD